MAARQLAIERSGDVLLADGYEVRRVDLRTGRIRDIAGDPSHDVRGMDATAERALRHRHHGDRRRPGGRGGILRPWSTGCSASPWAGRRRARRRPGRRGSRRRPPPGRGSRGRSLFCVDHRSGVRSRGRSADRGRQQRPGLQARCITVARGRAVVAGIGVPADPRSVRADDVPAAETCIGGPTGIAVDSTGAPGTSRPPTVPCAARDAETGIIRAVAGRATPCYDGDPRGDGGNPATEALWRLVEDVAVDGEGAVFIAEKNLHHDRIHRVDPRPASSPRSTGRTTRTRRCRSPSRSATMIACSRSATAATIWTASSAVSARALGIGHDDRRQRGVRFLRRRRTRARRLSLLRTTSRSDRTARSMSRTGALRVRRII